MGDPVNDPVQYERLRAMLLMKEYGGTLTDWLNQSPEVFELAWEYRAMLEGRRNPIK